MHANIKKLYLLNLLTGIVFWYPIEKLFMQEIGITPLGVSINAAVFILVVVLFDVPSGMLADRWKRTRTLAVATLALGASAAIGGISNSLSEYLVMNLFFGAYVVLSSGTFQATMYDTLKDIGKETEYDKHQGRSYALFLTGVGVSSLAGGYISAWFSYRGAYYASVASALVAFAVSLSLREPAAHRGIADNKLIDHVKSSLATLRASQLLVQLALFVTASSVLRSTQNEYSGLLFIALGMAAIPSGYANAIKWLSGALGQIVAPKFGRKVLRWIPLLFLTFLAFSFIESRWALPVFYLSVFLHAILSNQAEAEIQDHTPSAIRATTLSLLSFGSNLLLIPLGLLFGYITQVSGVFAAYKMIGIFGLAYLAVWILRGRKVIGPALETSQTTLPPQQKVDLV